MKGFAVLFAVVVVLFQASAAEQKYPKATIEMCPGCEKKMSPEMRVFIEDDVPRIANLELVQLKDVRSAVLKFYDADGVEKDHAFLGGQSVFTLRKLLEENGFAPDYFNDDL